MYTTHNTDILEDRAVNAALASDWAGAITANEEILNKEPNNIAAHLRLGFAAFQLKKYTQSLHSYRQVLKHQPQNMIALEYVDKITIQKEDKSAAITQKINLDPELFVEHPGRTKSAVLNQLGQKNILARLMIGVEVFLVVRKRHVEVRNEQNEYVGVLPDDIGVRLMYFFEHESKYRAFVQEATLSRIVLFIREDHKGKKVERMVSFPVDIPGSIARVMAAQQLEDADAETVKKPEGDDVDEFAVIEEKEDRNNMNDDLLNDLGGEDKADTEEILGIETDQDDEEEE